MDTDMIKAFADTLAAKAIAGMLLGALIAVVFLILKPSGRKRRR